LGYSHDEFGYEVCDPENNKVIRSQDMVFFEDQTLDDIKGEKLQPSQIVFDDMDPIPSPRAHAEGGMMVIMSIH